MARQPRDRSPGREPQLEDPPTGRQPEPADERASDQADWEGELAETMPGEAEPDPVWKSTRSRPRSADTADTGETEEGLDAVEESVRHAAEDRPAEDEMGDAAEEVDEEAAEKADEEAGGEEVGDGRTAETGRSVPRRR